MNIVIGILAFVIMLSVIVIVHEWGHYIAAKSFGVHVHEFSIGMGPALYQRQGKETLFSIRAIPFGGYCMMAGENDGSQDEDEDDWLKNVPEDQRLYTKKTWQQIVVMAAGVFMNFVLAAFIYIGLSLSQGYVVEEPKPVAYEIQENSPAAKAGLKAGDEIIAVESEGKTIHPATQFDLYKHLQFYNGESTFTIKRDGETFEVKMAPEKNPENSTYSIGIIAQAGRRAIPWYESIGVGLQNMWNDTATIFQTFGMLFQGRGLEGMSGPVGIYQVTQQATQYGFATYMNLFALISLNIGIFNLIPIPALDGGRILILAIERITRRKLNPKIVENVIVVSFLLLMGLFVFATYNDIMRLIGS